MLATTTQFVINAKNAILMNIKKVDAKTPKRESVICVALVHMTSIKWVDALVLVIPFANPVQSARKANGSLNHVK